MKLLIWDNQPAVMREQNISIGDVVNITSANTCLDKNGKIILNLEKFGEMNRISEMVNISRFELG